MADLTLYHSPLSRSSDVLWILEEIGEPYDVHLLNTGKGANRQPDYLPVNPMRKVPALRHADAIITETAAISGESHLEFFRAPWAGFAILNEMDSTGSWMIRDAGDGFGSLFRMLGGFGRPAHRQCLVARLS
jgi:hypothetical protein